MRLRLPRRLAAILAGGALAASGALLAGPALASTSSAGAPAAHVSASRPAAPAFDPGNSFIVAPRLSTNNSALDANGLGNQLQIAPPGSPTKWNSAASGTGYKISNNSGCWEQDGVNLNLKSCQQGDNAQRFNFSGTQGNTTITNVGTGKTVGVFNPNGPKPVYVEDQMQGFYVGFVTPASGVKTTAKITHAAAGYAVQQVNPTTWISPLARTLNKLPLAGSWIIKTRSGTTRELTAEGNGIDMEIHATGFSTFSRFTPNGATGDVYQTPNGLCVHVVTVGLVTGSTNCGASNTASQWYGDGSGRLLNVSYGNYLGVNSNSEGEVARMEPGTGAYYLTPSNIG